MKKRLIRVILTAALLIAAAVVEHTASLPMWQMLLIFLVPYLLISYDVIGEAIEGFAEGEPMNEDFLMCVATIGALGIGFLPGAESQMTEAVAVMLFFQIGELFEDKAEGESRRAISHLMDIRPDTATVERGGEAVAVSPDTVAVGETIIIKPGEKIPLDGIVTEGTTSLNTVALTGESRPRGVAVGDTVMSGCVNISGMIIVVIVAVVLAIVPPLLSAGGFAEAFPTWLLRALTFLVVSCPCALVISVPLTFFGGIGGASKQGILIKGSCFVDTLAKLHTVVFDKTGTLTRGRFEVEAVHPQECDATHLLHLAAHVERYSTHPIAISLREAYPDEQDGCTVENVEEIAGHGVRATVNGQTVCVGNSKMMELAGAAWRPCHKHGTIVHVAIGGVYAGHVVVNDVVKSDSAEAIAQLRQLGVAKTVMLTGDHADVGEQVARQVGIDEWHCELLPDGKVAEMERQIAARPEGRSLAFVGDGINDAPVLARADVGIAMGALGSDAAIDAADVVLMDDKPSKISLAMRISRRTVAIARQNVVFAIGVKLAVLLLAGMGLASMWMAVFADVGVTVIAVLNAMRTLRTK